MLRHLLYPFLVYRSIAYPFFVVSSVVVPTWLLFRLYRLRANRHPLSFRREALLLVFVLYLCGLAAATLTPNSRKPAGETAGVVLRPNLISLTCASPGMPAGSRTRFFCMYNAKGNVLLFVPLGILLPLVWTRLRFWRALQIAIAVSVGIELLQYVSKAWGSYRLADINDVLLNAFGASFGLLVVYLLRLRRRRGPAVTRV
jgi:glycopeptide antibiotics resistance protein